jgi:hypothetical protein
VIAASNRKAPVASISALTLAFSRSLSYLSYASLLETGLSCRLGSSFTMIARFPSESFPPLSFPTSHPSPNSHRLIEPPCGPPLVAPHSSSSRARASSLLSTRTRRARFTSSLPRYRPNRPNCLRVLFLFLCNSIQ